MAAVNAINVSSVVLAGGMMLGWAPLTTALDQYVHHRPASALVILLAAITLLALGTYEQLRTAIGFAWACFLKPLGKTTSQAQRLDRFYEGQAAIYDKTRARLLRGRNTMMRLSAAHLREVRRRDPTKRLVWLDIGGGTGANVEMMDKYFPISEFDAVYVLDLCGPLLNVAKERFRARGFKNVHCLLQDATTFVLPEWETDGIDPDGHLDFVTMSYSLSMMPDYLSLLDRIDRFLSPRGLLAVADFYVSPREDTSLSRVVGDVTSRQVGWLSRIFWQHWFEFDHVDLHPSRRQYLEHRFATIKSFNARNGFIVPFVVKIPYYVALLTSRRADTTAADKAYEVDSGNTISASASPILVPSRSYRDFPSPSELSLGDAVTAAFNNKAPRLSRANSTRSDSARINIAPEVPRSAFHYAMRHHRVPYLDAPVHKEFRTWIYGFTWEDPAVDIEYMNIKPDDSMLCITSAGDNALHYAIAAKPRRIHAVDMNPCQGHLLELKLAAISALSYDDFWKMFGDGRHDDFRNLLDTKISPFLTSHAYQFWRQNDQAFSSAFYLRGYSGHALRLAQFAIWISGVKEDVHKFCSAPTLDEQARIWNETLRPALLSRWIVKLFLSNAAFLWNALGVPMNQSAMFMNETTTEQYAIDTLDPVALKTHISTGAYHYQVCLEQKYTKKSCPLYLTPEAFETLKTNDGEAMKTFRLHTDSVVNVVKGLGKHSLTLLVLMDLQDWFPNTLTTKADDSSSKSKKECELTVMIRAIHRALKPHGRVFWRSAAMSPWYAELYAREGFRVTRVQKREVGSKTPIDRVNMYASLYKAVKI